jgi:hypothetical protein
MGAGRASSKGCAICQGPVKPGVRLCAQCKAALKRARQVTVSQDYPLPRRTSAHLGERRTRAEARPQPDEPLAQPTVELVRKPSRWQFAGAVIVAAVAVSAGGYLALHIARAGEDSVDGWTGKIPWPAALSSTEAPLPPPRREPGPDSIPNAVSPAALPAATVVDSARPEPGRTPSAKAAKPAPKREIQTTPAVPVVARFAAATEPPDPAPAVIPQVVVPQAPPPDRWQLLAEGIASCARENFIAGAICEQRVRLQYCDGYWGQVPQCPSGITNDHGR